MKKFLPLIMAAVMLICAGCDKQDGSNMTENTNKKSQAETTVKNTENKKQEKAPDISPEPPEIKTKAGTEQAQKMKVKIYYPDENGLQLVGVQKEVEVDNSKDKYTAAVEALKTPPTDKNLTSIVPKNMKLIGNIKVDNGTAIVNIDSSIKKGFVGGSTGEEFLVGSIVNTLTEFKEVKDVIFLIDGTKIESISGHMDLSTPVKRMDNLSKN